MKPLGVWLADVALVVVGSLLAVMVLFAMLPFAVILFLTGHPSMSQDRSDDVVR